MDDHTHTYTWLTFKFYPASRFLVAEVSHVQTDAVVLIGKGTGGYLAAMMMSKDNESVFRCGVVISPTTDWFRYGNLTLNCKMR